MTRQPSPLPAAWERASSGHDRNLGLLVRGMHDHRDEILEAYPLVKLPSDHPKVFTPVAALLLAWERWDYLRGTCPECGASALGISFGGLLNIGLVGGVCTRCALIVTRHIGGFAAAARGAQESVEGTPYEFRFVNWRWGFRGIPGTLVTVLRKLGVTDLPMVSSGEGEPVSGGAYFAEDGKRLA